MDTYDKKGNPICKPGEERYEEYYSAILRGWRVQYDYRTPDGVLFSRITHTLEEARARRDAWLAQHGYQVSI
jgi:hypothetical protein